MHLWTRLGFHIALPITCALYLVVSPPAQAMEIRNCTIAEVKSILLPLGTALEPIMTAIKAYNTNPTTQTLQTAKDKINLLQVEETKLALLKKKDQVESVIKQYKALLETALSTAMTPPHNSSTEIQVALEEICTQEIQARQDFSPRKDAVVAYFGASLFLGEDAKSKVEKLFSDCTETGIKFISAPANLQFDNCTGSQITVEKAREQYRNLLALRGYLEGKTANNIQAICTAWIKKGKLLSREGLTILDEKTPEEILPVPAHDDSLPEEMKALAKECHDVKFEEWYTVEDFKGDIIHKDADIYEKNLSPGIQIANSHKMLALYATKVASQAELSETKGWIDDTKLKNENYWTLSTLPTNFPNADHFKSGNAWFVTVDALKNNTVTFREALHYLSLHKCSQHNIGKSDDCIAKAIEVAKLPYPFNTEATSPTTGKHVIHQAFACHMRHETSAAVYDFSFAWPTRSTPPIPTIEGCASVTRDTSIRQVSMKGLPNLFAEAAGALRPASGLVAFHELQRIHSGEGDKNKHLFYMSLSQRKFNPTPSDSSTWQGYISKESEGLSDINFQKVITFFGSDMLFMQQGSEIPAIAAISKVRSKQMEPTVDALLSKIFAKTDAESLVTTNKLAGQYLNRVRANWVNEMVNPLYHAYYSGSGGKTFGETVTFQGKKSALERDKRLIDTAAFKLLMGLDPDHPPIVLDTTTGEVISFLEWGSTLKDGDTPAEMAYVPMILVDDYYKSVESPAQGLFPMVGDSGILSKAGFTGRKMYGLTKSDAFIRKESATSDRITVIPGSEVIGAMQALHMSIAEVIHRECTLQDEGFAQMMGKIRECKNNPQAVPTPSPTAALAVAAGSPPAPPPSPPDPCLPRPAEAIATATGGTHQLDICKAMAVMTTHYDAQLKEGIPDCSIKKWVPFFECAHTQGGIRKWSMHLIEGAIILQALFMILVDDGEKHWFWEWDKWKHTRLNPKDDDDDRAAQQAAANITTRTTEQRAASERAASTALGNLKSRLPSYSLRSSSAVRRSRGNVRSGADAVKSAGGKGKAPASTSKSGRTGTKSLPGLNFRIGPSK